MVTMSALPVCACRRALAASTRAVSEAPRLNVIKGFGNILYSNSTSTSAGSPRPVKPNGMCVRSRRPYSTDAVSAHTPSASTTTTDKNLHTVEASGAQQPTVHALFETQTGTWQYVVADPTTSAAVIIDPVLDYDRTARAVATASADALLSLVEQKRYRVDMILETHAHADHLTAASYLQRQLVRRTGHRPPIGIGKRIGQVQELFAERYGVLEEEYRTVFDVLLEDDEVFHIGQLSASAIHLPGHTPDHMGYKIGGSSNASIPHIDTGSLTLPSQTMSFAATRCSTRTLAPPAATSPAAVPTRSTPRVASFSACPPQSGSGRDTTTPQTKAVALCHA